MKDENIVCCQGLCLIMDFDGTITLGGVSSLGCFKEIFGKYYKNEIMGIMNAVKSDNNLSWKEKTRLFAILELELLSKYLKKNYDLSSLPSLFSIRPGYDHFLSFLSKNNIPLIICSSGIGNIIEEVLKYYSLDYYKLICANYYDKNYEFDMRNLIFSLKKYNREVERSIYQYHKMVVGNEETDLNMIPQINEGDLTILFKDDVNMEKTNFDIILPQNTNMLELKEKIYF